MQNFENSLEFAQKMDQQDPLRSFRDKFYFPTFTKGEPVYYTGNSLGLQPKTTQDYIQEELDAWSKYGVEGHFLAKKPWVAYHEFLTAKAAKVVGVDAMIGQAISPIPSMAACFRDFPSLINV